MRIVISDLSLVKGKHGPNSLIRFSITLTQEDGTPGLTIPGCLYTPEGDVKLPSTYMGRTYREVGQLSIDWSKKIKDQIEAGAPELVDKLPRMGNPKYQPIEQRSAGSVDA